MSDESPTTVDRNPTSAGLGSNIEARPKSWLIPVTLVLLREHSSYGYELMQRAVEVAA